MHRDDETDWTLLARYLANECSSEERSAVERWLAEVPARGEELEAVRRMWESSAVLPSASLTDAMWSRLAHRMRAADGGAATDGVSMVGRERPRRPTPILSLDARRATAHPAWRAAIAALAASVLFAAGVLAWRASQRPGRVAAEPPLREFTTTRGQRATVRLADGTRVELGFASTLRVRPFDGGRREMFLEGEAVFDVVHDSARPFLVYAANATTEDLGTTFAIRAYPGEGAVRVVVVSGLVALRPQVSRAGAPAQDAVLRPGMLGRLDTLGRVVVETGVDTTRYVGWLHGRVSFDDARVDEVIAELERRFDVPITIADPRVGARRITIDMTTGSLDEVLHAVAVPLDLRLRRTPAGVVLER